MRLSGNVWVPVGNYVSALNASSLSMAFNSNNDPYLAFVDGTTGNKATVMKYDGSNWNVVGAPGFSSSGSYEKLYINSQDIPYVGVQNAWPTAEIYKFDGTNWVAAANKLADVRGNFDYKLWRDTIPVVTYNSDGYSLAVTVRKFENGSWTNVGDYGIAPSSGRGIAVTVNSRHEPFAAFADSNAASRLSVMKFASGAWSYLGQPGFSSKSIGGPIFTEAGHGDTVYVAYQQNYVHLDMYDGTQWRHLDSLASNSDFSFAVDSFKTPHIAFSGAANAGKAEVKVYRNGGFQSLGSVASLAAATKFMLRIGADNTPYLAYYSGGTTYITQYINNGWQLVASGITQQTTGFDLDQNNVPYTLRSISVPASAGGCSGCSSLVVHRYDNNGWTVVGPNTLVTPAPNISAASFYIGENNLPIVYYNKQLVSGILAWNQSSWVDIATAAASWPVLMSTNYAASITSDSSRIYIGYVTSNGGPVNQYGSMYVYGLDVPAKPLPPAVVSPVNYCLGDAAIPLTATGQDLKWYDASGGLAGAPVPSTSSPGTAVYYVTQSNLLWESDKDSITVVVHPTPVPVISMITSYLQSSGPYSSYQWYYNGNMISGAVTDTLTAQQPGSYTVAVTDTNGCTGTSAAYTVCPVINTGLSQSSGTVTVGEPNAVYQWIDCSTNAPIAGATNQSYTPSVNGSYAVIVTVGSCSDTSSCIAVNTTTAGELASDLHTALYPNPGNGLFTLDMKEPAQLTILELTGKEVQTRDLKAGKNIIDLSEQPDGVYIVRLRTAHDRTSIKITVKR